MKHSDLSAVQDSRNLIRRVLATLTMAFGLLPVSFAQAANISWDGNGGANNDGNWSTALNWSHDGNPNGHTITLPDVDGNGNSGDATRTITVDANYTFSGLTINQSTAGYTNKVAWGGNLSTTGSGSVSLNVSAGTLILDKANYDWIFTHSTSLTLPAGTTLNSTGGRIGRNGNGGTPGHIINHGVINLTAGTTQFLHATGDILTNNGTINLSGGSLTVQGANTLINHGTIAGNGSSMITVRNLQLMAGSSINGIGTLAGVATFDLQATDHTAINLSGTTLSAFNVAVPKMIEVGTNTAGRFQVGQLTVNSGTGNNRTMLVDNHVNDQSSTDPERLEVNTLAWAGNNNGELDMNGLDITVNTALLHSPYQRVLSNRKAGSSSTITLGNSLDLGSIMNNDFNGGLSLLVQNGATLEMQQTVPMSYLNVEAGSGRINVNSSAAAFSGGGIRPNTVLGHTWSDSDDLTVDFGSGNTYTLLNGSAVSVGSGASVKLIGNVKNQSQGSNGLISTGAGTRVEITGNYTTDLRGKIGIGSGATLALGGNFAPSAWWNGLPTANRWAVDTSATPGIFVMNGGGTLQTMETMSNTAAVGTDAFTTDWTCHPFGEIRIGDGATTGHVQLVDNVRNHGSSPTSPIQVARAITVGAGSTLDLNGLDLVLGFGFSVITGNVIDSQTASTDGNGKADITLIQGADLGFGSGTLDIAGTFTAGAGSVIDLSTADLFSVGVLDLSGGGVIDFFGREEVLNILQVGGDVTTDLTAWIDAGQILNTGGNEFYALYDELGGFSTLEITLEIIPEPASLTLLLFGGLALLRRRRRGGKCECVNA